MRGIAGKKSGPPDFEAEKPESIQSKKVHQIKKSKNPGRENTMRKMNRMSRMMTGLISAAAVLTLITGCGGTAKGYAADADAVKNAGKAKDAYDMAYVVAVEDEWLGLLKDEVVDAAKEKGVNMELFYSGNDTMKLISCVEAAKSKGKDAVLINLNAAEQARACIEAAGDDMKVVFLNREPDDLSLLNDNVAAVGSDEHTSGKFQGEFLAEYFKEDVAFIFF